MFWWTLMSLNLLVMILLVIEYYNFVTRVFLTLVITNQLLLYPHCPEFLKEFYNLFLRGTYLLLFLWNS